MVSAASGFVRTTGVPPAAGTACSPSDPDPANTMTSSGPQLAPANEPGTWANVWGLVPDSATCFSAPSRVTNPIRSPSGEKNGLLPFSVPASATASKLFSDRRYSLVVVPPPWPTKTSSEPSGESANGAVQESPTRVPGGSVTDSRVVRTTEPVTSERRQTATSDAAPSRATAIALIHARRGCQVVFGGRRPAAETALPA